MLRAVIPDVGETLVEETRTWGERADLLGTARLTFFAALGSSEADADLRALGLAADLIVASESVGAAEPSAAFDVLPATRGPWGLVHARRAEVVHADARIDGLAELPDLLDHPGSRPRR